ncbi:dihydrodipicolinate synthase family protein [Halobacterium sp. KA-4]|jgi:4-hydroxy-tetrahydrodipicolinate synthase|uniref:dihydrodipicolinate synthase family protein n=1 Tax=Halobacterium sp. KA-4 TaxID=2896367 RepID=UPI001E61A2B7|nr:dihydrodipicolinate synthase family protein [Halobacterium sp. KA-4]MCD2198800.1 dihydrodipicolinate synthase family protein [Halobacterium sp. KA-4]
MNGLGVPLVTPFDGTGSVDHDALADLAAWVTDEGADFLVPCGSNSEAELLTAGERAAVVETVVEAVPADVPVLAGTGSPGLRETLDATVRAADAGADGALVVTPFYYDHDQADFAAYYREVAEQSPLPVYLYSVPAYTDVRLDPRTVESLATHPNIAGMKDSAGDLAAFQRTREYTADADFELFVGSGGVFAAALDAGADGGILAVSNVVPERADEIAELHTAGKDEAARDVNRRILDLDHAVTAEYGVPGLKAAMRSRDRPAGIVRSPHRPVDDDAAAELAALVDEALP